MSKAAVAQIQSSTDKKDNLRKALRLIKEARSGRAELIAFLDAVRTGNVPAVTGDEGVASLEIAIRCLEQPAKPAASAARKGPRRIAG